MSGPIVRKYGFPNHEAIFGKKEIAHGVDEGEESAKPSKAKKATSTAKKAAPKKKAKE
jgi:hypothetical protein